MGVKIILSLSFSIIFSAWILPCAICRIIPFGLHALSSKDSPTSLPLKGKDLKRDWCVGRSMARKVHLHGCNSTEVKTKLCFGQCMTFYIQTGKYPAFSTCSQCSPSKIETIEVKLQCARGLTKKKKVQVVRRCSCRSCNYAQFYLCKMKKELSL